MGGELRGYSPEEEIGEVEEANFEFSEDDWGPTSNELMRLGLSRQEILSCLILITNHYIVALEDKGAHTPLSDKEGMVLSALMQIQAEVIQTINLKGDPALYEQTFDNRVNDFIFALQGFGVPEDIFDPDIILQIRDLSHRVKDLPRPQEEIDIDQVHEEVGAEIARDNEADFWEEVERRTAESQAEK